MRLFALPPALRACLALPLALLLVLMPSRIRADGPADNIPDKVRRIPPPGITVPDDVRKELSERVDRLGEALDSLQRDLGGDPNRASLLPDIRIFHKAVDWALRYDEFYHTNEFVAARRLLDEAAKRMAALRSGSPYWTEARGLVVRGYVSRVDGSIQPYGLVVPEAFDPHDGRNYRLDLWFHGRGEQLTELAFLSERMRRIGEFAPRGAFVLHPYGRYCNGSRFAGETDAWEALADVQRHYPIDEDRLVVRGFSLGGASCWHMATHHAWRWAAAAPGAGFSETAEFLRVFQHEGLAPTWWEQKLWNLYDSTSIAANVAMVPLVAYSGELDTQRQAARAMEKAMADQGLALTHIVGPGTRHQYEPGAKAEIARRIDAIAARGRNPLPRRVRFETYSLRYNRMAWIVVDGLDRHWESARVDAELVDPLTVRLSTTNITALTLEIDPGLYPFELDRPPRIRIDDQDLPGPRPGSDRSWRAELHRDGTRWQTGPLPGEGLRKVHGLQGPVDDAFMDSFLFVRPTGSPINPALAHWVDSEMNHAVDHWRRQFRGDAPIKDDTEVTPDDIATRHLILWGDPQSNHVLARMIGQLPIQWDASHLRTPSGDRSVQDFVPVLIYPNPLNPAHYVVLNSGFTFREYDYLNNARQTPKLPDWAIVDLRQPATSRAPGAIADAGFFDEHWQWARRE